MATSIDGHDGRHNAVTIMMVSSPGSTGRSRKPRPASSRSRAGRARFALPTLRMRRNHAHVVDQFPDRKDDPAADHEQDRPHHIVDLLFEIGYGLRSLLRTHEHGSQEEKDWHRGHDDPDQFEHAERFSIPLHRGRRSGLAPPSPNEFALPLANGRLVRTTNCSP